MDWLPALRPQFESCFNILPRSHSQSSQSSRSCISSQHNIKYLTRGKRGLGLAYGFYSMGRTRIFSFPAEPPRFLCPFSSIVIPSRYLANLIACNGKLCVVLVAGQGCHLPLSSSPKSSFRWMSRWDAYELGSKGNGSFFIQIEVQRETMREVGTQAIPASMWFCFWCGWLCYYHQRFLNCAYEAIWPV